MFEVKFLAEYSSIRIDADKYIPPNYFNNNYRFYKDGKMVAEIGKFLIQYIRKINEN